MRVVDDDGGAGGVRRPGHRGGERARRRKAEHARACTPTARSALRSGVRICDDPAAPGGTEFSLDVVDVGDGVSALQVRDAAGAAKFEVASA